VRGGKRAVGEEADQICTLRADMSRRRARSWRSSVEGNGVRAYVSLSTLSWFASARRRFFLITGSSSCGAGGRWLDPACSEAGTLGGWRAYGDERA
jgi:hypothetical protein